MKKIDIIKEVYTEKQRRWACSQIDAPKSERVLSKSEATEMCKDVKLSKSKDKKAKMKKKDLVEYITHKKSINEQNDIDVVEGIGRTELSVVFRWINHLRGSGLINMFGAHPLLNWTKNDLERWLYSSKNDIESIESEIENLDYDNYEGENDDEIESLNEKKEHIEYLLDNKDEVRDILVRVSLRRIEYTTNNYELSNVNRVFEQVSKEIFTYWMKNY